MAGRLPIYLDYNATTPVDPRVLEEMLPWFSDQFGNAASSTHPYGWQGAEAVKIAREQLAQATSSNPEEWIFTSGSTEGINLALKGVADLYAARGDHFITVKTEHKAVLDVAEWLEKTGKRVTYLDVNEEGLVDLGELKAAMIEGTVLVSVMLANNETGVIQQMEEIAELVHEKGAILMSDATQAIGKMEVNVDALGIDLMPVSAHKFYGPKGVGALYLRKRRPKVVVSPLLHGGGHERGFRSGTLNVPGIVGLGKAVEIAADEWKVDSERISGFRDQLEKDLIELEGIRINGLNSRRLPNTSNISFSNTDGDSMIKSLSGLAISTGSACTSAVMEPSHVLAAMSVPDELAFASARISLGRMTTKMDIETAIREIRSWRLGK